MRLRTGIVCTGLVVLAVVAFQVASADPAGRSATGGGKYVAATVLGNQLVEFGFSGVESPDGSVKGQGQSQIKSIGFKVQFKVLDLVFDGNKAWILGEVTKGDPGPLLGLFFFGTRDLEGWRFINGVKDRGEGANADPDLVSPTVTWDLAGPASTWDEITQASIDALLAAGNLNPPTAAMTAGNVQVRNPDDD